MMEVMDHEASPSGGGPGDGPAVVCRTCHVPLRKEGTHLRVVFGQVQVCHGPGGYVRIEVGPAGDAPSRPRRRRRHRAA